MTDDKTTWMGEDNNKQQHIESAIVLKEAIPVDGIHEIKLS